MDTGCFFAGNYLLVYGQHNIMLIQNTDKTPVKNQSRNFLHINTVHCVLFFKNFSWSAKTLKTRQIYMKSKIVQDNKTSFSTHLL